MAIPGGRSVHGRRRFGGAGLSGVPCQDGIEHVGDEPLPRLGQAADGIELLFEAGDWPAPGAARRGGGNVGGVIVGDQRLDRNAKRLCEAGK